VHKTSISHHLHSALPANHRVTSFQAPASGDVTNLPQFYPDRISCEAAGQTSAFLHVRITSSDMTVWVILAILHHIIDSFSLLLICIKFALICSVIIRCVPQRNRHVGLEEMERFARRFKRRRIALGNIFLVNFGDIVTVICILFSCILYCVRQYSTVRF